MKFNKEEVFLKLTNPGLVPLYYDDDYELCKEIIISCYHAGVNVFEFTNRGINAFPIFEKLYQELKELCPNLALGIGTIYTATEAKIFAELGADFIVQPICNYEVGDYCKSKNLTWIPGAMTLNEIYYASSIGADIVKVFPGNVLSPSYIKAIKGPFPNVKLMITGGVEPNSNNINEWFSSGVSACGLGSQLFNSDEKIKNLTATLKSIIADIKK